MRIAVAQLEWDEASRAATFQNALEAIDAAAETDPCPDLVLLPAFHDVPAFLVGIGTREWVEHCEGQTMAACGLRARQWGIYIAAAMAEASRDKPYIAGVLLDRDGDTRLKQRQQALESPAGDGFAPGEGFEIEDILLGRMAMLVGADVLDPAMWDAANEAGAGLVLSPGCLGTCRSAGRKKKVMPDPADFRSAVAEQAKRCGIPVAVADMVTREREGKLCCPGCSLVIDGEGNVRATAELHEPGLIWADLAVPQPAELGDSQV